LVGLDILDAATASKDPVRIGVVNSVYELGIAIVGLDRISRSANCSYSPCGGILSELYYYVAYRLLVIGSGSCSVIDIGLRAVLSMQSFITGQLMIEIEREDMARRLQSEMSRGA
jgi:hypothetical protein